MLKCVICGEEFVPRRANQKYCNRCRGKVQYNKRVSDYGNGTIYVLNMRSWEWAREERGRSNG